MKKKKIQLQVVSKPIARHTSLCLMVCFTLLTTGCVTGNDNETAQAPELKKMALMEHEPITRLAFVSPQNEQVGEIKILMDDAAQGAADIESAAGDVIED